MAEVRGFRAVRYNPLMVEDLGLVTCPPYDIISVPEQDRLYQRHPFNAVRLEQGKANPSDPPGDNKYTRSAAQYRTWLRDGVLQMDQQPALYVYDQEFEWGGRPYRRRSLLGAVRLAEWDKGVVLPHEHTMPRPKSDRLQLLQACRASFSPLLALYEDCDGAVSELLQRVAEAAPDASFADSQGDADSQGERHFLWAITDTSILNAVGRSLLHSPVFMADGHHRYETALAFRDEWRAANPDIDGDTPYDFVMMALEATDDPGILVLPTHRLVAGPPRIGTPEILSLLSQHFQVQEHPISAGRPGQQVREHLAQAGAGETVFALYAGGDSFYLLRLKDPGALHRSLPTERSTAWKELDVVALQTTMIEGVLGGEKAGTQLSFTRDEDEAIDAVRKGDEWLALFLRPTRVEQLREVAMAGDRMPEKSTYFYPKLLSGLVIYAYE